MMQKYGLSALCTRNIIENNLLYAPYRIFFTIIYAIFHAIGVLPYHILSEMSKRIFAEDLPPPGTYAKRFRCIFLPNPARTENGCFTVSGILLHYNRAYSQHLALVSAICEKPVRSDKTNLMIIHAVNQFIPFDNFPIISLCIANCNTGRQSAFRYVAEYQA